MGWFRAAAIGLGVGSMLAVSAVAGAAVSTEGPKGETVMATMSIQPHKGPLYRNGSVPVNAELRVIISVPANQLYLTPTRKGMVRLPADVSFHPKASMPACTDAMMSSAMELSIPPAAAVAKCPDSVIGNGFSNLAVAGGKNAKADAVLIIFYAGKTLGGYPKFKIWGYSKNLNAGVMMQGTLLADNSLEITVPSLPVKTAIVGYDLKIPGTSRIQYNGQPVPGSRGLDPSYIQARCSTGRWTVTSVATFGDLFDDGAPDGPAYPVASPDFHKSCIGLPGSPPAGKPRVGKVILKGPGSVKSGHIATFRVVVLNPGNGSLKGVRLTASGKGVEGSAGPVDVPVGGKRTLKVRVKFSRKGRVKAKFVVKSRNGGNKKVLKAVKVR